MELTIDQAFQKAVEAHKAGQVQEADRWYTAILKAQPKHPDANHNLGVLAISIGKANEALPFLNTALEANPSIARFWLTYIDALMKLDRIADAKAVLDQAKSKGFDGDAFNKLETRLSEASGVCGPTQDQVQSIINLYNQGQLQQALKQVETLVKQFPNSSVLFNIQGAVLQGLGQLASSVDAYKKALAIKPDDAETHNNMGISLKQQGKLDEAIEAHTQAIFIKPDYAEAFTGMGNALMEKGDLEKAIWAYENSIIIQPSNAKAYYNIGVTLHEQGKLKEAIEAYKKSLAVNPDIAESHYNMGVALAEQGQFDEAIEAHREAILIKPDYAEAFNCMGNALKEKGELQKAIEAYNKTLAIEPDYESVRVQKLYQQANICDWDNLAKDLNLITKLGTTKKHVSPFAMLTLEDNPARHRKRSEIYAKANFFQEPSLKKYKLLQSSKRLKIGYFSADFHNHATMHLMSQIFARHNRLEFEIFVYSYGPDRNDEMRKKLVVDVDHFHDVGDMDDVQIVNLARNHEINIAIDLKGYTQDSRLAPFAYGMAPVQISYLGFPGTLGTNFIDYIVADPVLIPENRRQHFAEQIIYLPDTYQPTDNTRAISNKIILREDVGLPNDVFVFCCFNKNYKISPTEFNIWMRLLKKVEKSVLWLLRSNQWAEQNLKREAEKRGINPERLIFAEKLPNAEHLARHKLADLFLDTFNVNAHTTASDSLWAGLPVVTKFGQGFAARVAGSLLQAIGLPELITESVAEYEALAFELATNPERLAGIKSILADNRLTQPLFDTEQYTKHLEAGYKMAYARYFSGQQPDHIFVKKILE